MNTNNSYMNTDNIYIGNDVYSQMNVTNKIREYDDTVSIYTTYYSLAIFSTNKYDDLTECIKQEDFDTLQSVFKEFGEIVCSPNLTTVAAEVNRLDILKFLINQGCCWDSKILLNATKHNNTEMIEYCINTPSFDQRLYTENLRIVVDRCPWNPDCINYLAKFNQFEYFKLMYSIYFPSLQREERPFWSKNALEYCNNIEFLNFYLQHNIHWSCLDIIHFIRNHNLEAVKLFYTYYLEYKKKFTVDLLFERDPALDERERRGNLDFSLKNRKWSIYLVEQAISNNSFDIAHFLITTFSDTKDNRAVLLNHTPILKLLNDNSYQLYKLCYNKRSTLSDWWIDLISSIDKNKIIKYKLLSIGELNYDIIYDLRSKYCYKMYENVITKDLIQYCILEYL